MQSIYLDSFVIIMGDFKDYFNEYYCPHSHKNDKHNEFLKLVQTSTVAESKNVCRNIKVCSSPYG